MTVLEPAPIAPEAQPVVSGTAPHWYVAARSDQLARGAPLARRILGRSLVLYRDTGGRPVALDDRCPHKNAPLSIGRVAGDRLLCRYHGWAFDRTGACVDVPCHGRDERRPVCGVGAFPAVEQDGWIWLWMGGPGIDPPGPPPAHPKEAGYRWFELHSVVEAPLDLILENGLDCSHTGFAHEGLFRSAPTQLAQVRLEETPRGVRAETIEKPAAGRDTRSLLGGRREVRHIDEILLPHTLRVDYRIGDSVHVITILVATPETDGTTRLYTRMGVRYGRITWLMTPIIGWITRRVVIQDRAVLEAQSRCIRDHGGRAFRGVVADLPAAWYQRARALFDRGAWPPAGPRRVRDIAYKL